MRTLLRWWLIFWLTVLGCGAATQAGLFASMWNVDHTYLSSVTLFIFTVITAFIGYLGYAGRNDENVIKPHLPLCWFTAELLMGLGMLGTLSGFLMLLQNALGGSVGDASNVQKMIASMSVGFGTAATTTIVGLATSLLTKLQLINLEYLVTSDEG